MVYNYGIYRAFLYIFLQKAANGQVASEKTSPAKKTLAAKAEAPKKATKGDDVDGKLKEHKQENNKIVATKKEKEQLSTKSGKENKMEQTKNKKNLKNLFQEKPVDFDDGWLICMYQHKQIRCSFFHTIVLSYYLLVTIL